VLVLGVVQGAYSTEVLRAAIQAVPRGQLEAAQSLGMSPLLAFRRIMLPAMLPNAVPGMGNLWLNITKDSALISIVGFGELALVTQQVAGATRRYFVIYLISQMIYLLISQVSLAGFVAIERRLRRGQPLPLAVH
jgi:polar amino acid transport system permease protein